jgi:cytidylate kinase
MSSGVFSKVAAATLVAVALSTSACVRISSTSLAPSVGMYNPDSVRVFAVNRPPEYTELAILRTHRFLVSDTRVLEELKKRAAQVGANAILLINAANSATQSHSGSGVIITGRDAGNVVIGDAETKIDAFERAVAIRIPSVVGTR